jgi:hypothetical protein
MNGFYSQAARAVRVWCFFSSSTFDASLRTTSLDDPDLVGVWDSYEA